ncbi:AraC family transcriptional regulator [Clostridium bowmanii]|uniref:AraC family transcriptional regulator n=1 Tax=Clostridium bowmanii TaxID=132925 RepID=UPI001C0E2A20|nr:AraC family transcriptional regulator [Clostridium bowmanii]MBU3191021.1 AraC family transcriptional regulator [Clostridium bowmanii]MCA1075343.1 AraC family transcriptional regulator [Clostridium bowmanii]
MINIPELLYIWYYKAPKIKNHTPRIIPQGQQEVEIFFSGRGFFEYEDSLLQVVSGTILWHTPGDKTIYMNDLEHPYECIVVAFKYENIRNMPRVSHWTDKSLLQQFISDILNEYHKDCPDMTKLACYVYGQLYWQSKAPGKKLPLHEKRSIEIQRVIDFIEKHFAENINIDNLSQVADISVPHFHALFKKFTGNTPYQFIQARRLQESKILLASTRLSVKEITLKSGFHDIGNFCRVFKHNNGVTAQEYRLRYTDKR